MTRLLMVLALACASVISAAQPDPSLWLTEARTAMGGDAAFTAVTEVKLGGNIVNSSALRSSHIAWEATWRLPDHFQMQETHTIPTPMGANAMTTKSGFRGEKSLFEIVSSALSGLGPMALGLVPPLSPQEKAEKNAREVRTARRFVVRLMVPLFASADIVSTVMPLTMTAGTDVAMPAGPAHLINISGTDDFSMRLLVDAATHLPVLVSWKGPPVQVGSAPRPGTVVPSVPDVEHQYRFEDFETKDGRHWPRRITHIADGKAHAEFRLTKHSVKR
jgi:hypothetical protein